MADLQMFIPLTKIDEEKRLVYGVATAEQPDRAGEICDYATTKPYYEEWSSSFSKSTGGKSKGNIRAMHGDIAVGKVAEIHFNDEAKQIEVCAKIVDDNEWQKVLEGVYTGFSQGGAYVKRWTHPEDSTKKVYTARPSEISLVDLPCLPTATFSVIKADGQIEMRKFHSVEDADLEKLVEETAEDILLIKGCEWPEAVEDACVLISALYDPSMEKFSVDQARDALGRWVAENGESAANYATGAAIGGAKGAILGALTAGAGGAVVGGIIGATTGAAERSPNAAVRAAGAIVSDVTAVVGVGRIASRALQARGAMNATVAAANTVAGATVAASEVSDSIDAVSDHGGIEQHDRQTKFNEALERQREKMASDAAAAERRKGIHAVKGTSGADLDTVKERDNTMTLKKTLTNDEVIAHATVLAKAAGDEAKWSDFLDKARAELEEGLAKKEETKVEEPLAKKEEATPPVSQEPKVDEVEQVWLAKDGSTHKKKAEALAKNAEIDAAAAAAAVPAIAALDKVEALIKGAGGEDEKKVDEEEEELDDRAKLAKYIGEEVWDVGRALEATNILFGLLAKEASETEAQPGQVLSLQTAIGALKAFIVSEIQEDNASEDDALKIAATGALAKVDAGHLQKAHDSLVAAGAKCSAAKAEQTDDLAKVAGERDGLQKILDSITPRIESLAAVVEAQQEEIRVLKAQPIPAPNLRIVAKGSDVRFDGGSEADAKITEQFAKLSPEDKATLLVKLAQQNPLRTVAQG